MARSAPGACVAAVHWVAPKYDPPIMPTAPDDHGWAAAQAMVSAPSRASSENGLNSPPDPHRPRVSWTTTAYPAWTPRMMSKLKPISPNSLLYGVRWTRVGNGPGPSGRYTSAASVTPSLIGTVRFLS